MRPEGSRVTWALCRAPGSSRVAPRGRPGQGLGLVFDNTNKHVDSSLSFVLASESSFEGRDQPDLVNGAFHAVLFNDGDGRGQKLYLSNLSLIHISEPTR